MIITKNNLLVQRAKVYCSTVKHPAFISHLYHKCLITMSEQSLHKMCVYFYIMNLC